MPTASQRPAANEPPRPSYGRTVLAAILMCAGVVAVYVPVPEAADENVLLGYDYHQLHARRIRYAQESLATTGSIPAWHSRELMGSPFRANLQNFPLVPTRLVLLAFDPGDAYLVGVMLAAVLSALFTFAFARRLGVGRVGAAAAGWTFACSGYFAARVLAGHLPLLEPYPLLPLLLWLVEASAGSSPEHDRWYPLKLAGLAGAAVCLAVAGHPQLPFYAVGVAGLYLLFRGRRWRAVWPPALAIGLGTGCAAFAAWPMLLLIGRSTRVLDLRAPGNDIAFPYGRLGALLFPWKDGWPATVADGRPFAGYPNDAYFWDTVCYVGWAPVLATAALLAWCVVRRRVPAGPWAFLAAAGVLALATALPVVADLLDKVPGTLVRSPARQVYVTTFALAMALGAGVHRLAGLARPGRRWPAVAVGLLLVAHAVDLGTHARSFVAMTAAGPAARGTLLEQGVRQDVGDGRVAIDGRLGSPFDPEIDDPKFFDSIMLAKPYAAMMRLCGAPPGHNVQMMDGSAMPARALAAAGVRLVLSARPRPDLRPVGGAGTVGIYRVPNPLPRAGFLPAHAAVPLDEAATLSRLGDPAHDLARSVMVPPDAAPAPPATTTAPATTAAAGQADRVTYDRPSSDEIAVRVTAGRPGFLRVVESWDPGWSATVGGNAADVIRVDGAYLGVPLPAGDHDVRLRYATPGAATGMLLTGVAACLTAGLLWWARRRYRPAQGRAVV